MRLVEVFLTYGLILHAAAAQNYYQLLGVKHTAPAADIKRSFRSLAKQYHPDKSGNKRDADRFMQSETLVEDPVTNWMRVKAYETLINRRKRQQYDAKLKFQSATFDFGNGFFQKKSTQSHTSDGEPSFGADFPFADLFNMFFDAVKNRQAESEPTGTQSHDKTDHQKPDSALTRFIVHNVLKALKLATAKTGDDRQTSSMTDRIVAMLGSCASSGGIEQLPTHVPSAENAIPPSQGNRDE